MTGIYQIINKQNDRRYIGKSSNLFNRLNTHISDLIGNRHTNIILQKDFNKYGYNGFMFEILDICSIEDMGKLESYYIKLLDSENDYNVLGLRTKEKKRSKRCQHSNAKNNVMEIIKKADEYILINYSPGDLVRVTQLKENLEIKDRLWKDKIIYFLKNAKLNDNKRLERIKV